MSLLGWPLLAVLAVLAIGLPVATALLWARIRRPAWARTVARVGLLLGCQVAAVLLVAAGINDYGYFYGSWAEVVEAVPQNVGITPAHTGTASRVAARTGTNPASAGRITTTSDPTFSAPSQWAHKGRLEAVTLTGATSRLSSHGFIYFPPQYFQRAYARDRFPGVEVLTGYPGDAGNLAFQLRYENVLRSDMAQHRARPMVLVMLRSSVTYPRDAECTDIPAGPQALTYFAQDVPSQVSLRYRVHAVGWGAIGTSTGGYCAAKIAMTHPSVFFAAASLSGYYNALHDNTTGNLWGHSVVVRHLNNLQWRLRHLPAPPVSLLVTTGSDEYGPEGKTDTARFVHLAKPPLTVDEIVLPHGGHNFTSWKAELPACISWLSARLGRPVPT
jgi:hypothetical protein